jgi:hypothetical protein
VPACRGGPIDQLAYQLASASVDNDILASCLRDRFSEWSRFDGISLKLTLSRLTFMHLSKISEAAEIDVF